MSANMILKSNCIFDSVKDEPFAGFVAVKGNKIAAVGSGFDDLDNWAGPETPL